MASWQRIGAALLATAALCGCIPQVGPPGGYDAPEPARRARQPPSPPSEVDRPPAPARSADDTGTVRAVDLPDRAQRGDQPETVRQPAPSRVAPRVVADATTVPDSTYTVKPGQTLRTIGNETGAGSEAIARANGLSAPFTVRAGQRLRIPGGRYHLVRQGESGVAIARAYGVRWSELVTLNDLQEPYLLRNGQRLLLPSSGDVASRSVEQRAQAFQLDIDDLATGSEPALAANARPARPTESARRPVPAQQAVAEPTRFAGRFDWPLEGRIIGRFGPAGDGRRNDGINIDASRGEPIHAAADGVVAYAGSAIAIYGGLILIKHGDGWITAYGHAEQILVTRGQAVKRGDIIARAGATGSVNKPQLHFEIRDKRTPVDPLRYLPDRG